MGYTRAQENRGHQGHPGSVGTPPAPAAILHGGKGKVSSCRLDLPVSFTDMLFYYISLLCEIGQRYHLPAIICLDNITQHLSDPRGALWQTWTNIKPLEVCFWSKGHIQ